MHYTQLALRYIARHNDGVKSGDFRPLLALFHPDAEFVFQSIEFGPFRGREAIENAFIHHPPDDELEVMDVSEDEGGATIRYAWRRSQGSIAGTIRLEAEGEFIHRLVVDFRT